MWCIAQTMGLDVAHSGSLCLASDDTALASDWSRWLQYWPLIGWNCLWCWPPLTQPSGIFMRGSCNNKSRSDWIPAWLIRSEIPQIRFYLMTEILRSNIVWLDLTGAPLTGLLLSWMNIVNNDSTCVKCGAALMREYWIFTVVRRQYY